MPIVIFRLRCFINLEKMSERLFILSNVICRSGLQRDEILLSLLFVTIA